MTYQLKQRWHYQVKTSIIKRTLHNQRSKLYPPVPESLKDLKLIGEWTTTAAPEPKPFLFFDNGPDTEDRIIAFGSDESLSLLASADTWLMDGNYAMAPQGFLQLYVIRVPIGNTAVSTIFACLQNKTQHTYETFLQALMDHCHEIELYPDPTTIIVDFEQAVIQAISNIFGPETHTQGCFYHLTQSTWRKIQDLGLTTHYKDSEAFCQFCGQIDSLAFLPVEDVTVGIQLLKDRCTEEAAPLLEYFDQTYVSGTYVQRRCHQQRRIPPRFPPELWNIHEATLNDCPRTNNLCEGWNNKFYHLVGYQHLSIWKLIRVIQQEEAALLAASQSAAHKRMTSHPRLATCIAAIAL
ncbi:uncharacterized protein LOC123513257 [Portunus trituberculatus]|uniref:uncharacterized protein LOC123513257 n=1 Tax=Portunus trituberculatus TaxID=210409 RepID=UPI001E1CC296|nr:uncharacterized protein LOC123513257 [Portunus trituberculatus]